MNDPSGFVAAGTIFAIFIVVAVLVLWRVKKHASERAEAEARMSAAMQELQLLAARLQAQKRVSGAMENAGGERRDAPPST